MSDDGVLRARLRAEVVRYCPARLRDQVDDIAQLAWMRLDASRKKDARNREPGSSLIKRVAFCAAMDESRRLQRRREVPLDTDAREPGTVPTGPHRAAVSAEIRTALQECLMVLRENRSLAVTLYLQGHTGPEAGRLLGWSTSKAESLIFRGLADLRRCLARKGITP